MISFIGLAAVGSAVALSRRHRALSGPTGDKLVSAWADLTQLLLDWTEKGIRVEDANPESPLLPPIGHIHIHAETDEERCAKTNDYFYTLFLKTEKLEKAAGAEFSGDIIDRKRLASRLRRSGSKGIEVNDVETVLEEAHEIQRGLLKFGTRIGCYGRQT